MLFGLTLLCVSVSTESEQMRALTAQLTALTQERRMSLSLSLFLFILSLVASIPLHCLASCLIICQILFGYVDDSASKMSELQASVRSSFCCLSFFLFWLTRLLVCSFLFHSLCMLFLFV